MHAKAIIIGRLGRDPELRYTPKGTAVAELSVAVTRKWKDQSGNPMEETSWLNLVAFGKTGEVIAQYMKKGSLQFFECRVKQDTWEDKQTGQKRTAVKFLVESFTILTWENSEQDGISGHSSRPAAQRSAAPPPPDEPPFDDDDVPF